MSVHVLEVETGRDHQDLGLVEQLGDLLRGPLRALVLGGHPRLGRLLHELLADGMDARVERGDGPGPVGTGAGLVGDWALLWMLRRVPGRTYLRASAFAALAAYPIFLLVPDYGAKLGLVVLLGLLNSGWYAIPKAGLYAALPGRSGAAVAVGGIGVVVLFAPRCPFTGTLSASRIVSFGS